MTPRIVFMGSPGFAVPALTALCERPDLCEVVGVVSQPDKPVGRGQKLQACAVKVAAEARGIKTFTPTKLKPPESLAELASFGADLAVVAAYGRILPPAWLSTPRLGCVNIHASLLPRWRGASPIHHAILEGDKEAGVAIMRMEEGLDTGPVYLQRGLPVASDDTTLSLTIKLAELGAKLMLEALPGIVHGTLAPKPQPSEGVTYAKVLDKLDGALDFSRSAEELERRVRAMNPWPLAFFVKGDVRVQVLRAHVEPHRQGAPGSVLDASSKGVVVACGRGALVLDEVKPAGKGSMAAAAWVAGRGVTAGEVFT